MSDKKVFGITLFEEPLVRSFLLADDFDLIRKISTSYNLVIFTTSPIKKYLLMKVPIDLLDKLVFAVPPLYLENKFTKFFGFLLRYSENSLGNKRLRYINYEKKVYGVLGLILRNFVNLTFSSRHNYVDFTRSLYLKVSKNLNMTKFVKCYNLDKLFITSLTNWSEDIQVACAAHSLNIRTIGTPRSWDNLVSHGSLRFIPDIFLAHSDYMSECASKYQHISNLRIIGTSTYRVEFLQYLDSNKEKRVGYGCVGPNSHPSELKFLIELHDYLENHDFCGKFLVIQHPRFPHIILKSELFPKFEIRTFNFLSEVGGNLQNYYGELASLSILFTSGSTIALDSLFVGTPVVCTNFDLIDVPYWQSASRYFSHRTHFRDLVEHLQLPIVNSWDEFKQCLDHTTSELTQPINFNKVSYFTGMQKFDFKETIMEIFES
jgi:hypothetical protein